MFETGSESHSFTFQASTGPEAVAPGMGSHRSPGALWAAGDESCSSHSFSAEHGQRFEEECWPLVALPLLPPAQVPSLPAYAHTSVVG